VILAPHGHMELRTDAVVENGDLAVVHSAWTITGGRNEDDQPEEMASRSTVVVRQQADRFWRCLVDDAYSRG
jgi:ketosteroid isomerase-like protein